MNILRNTKIKWGIVDFHAEEKLGDFLSFVEYRIDSLEDVKRLDQVGTMCIVHVPDPQQENWLEIIKSVSKFDCVAKINTHARSEDFYLLCDSCGSRLFNTWQEDQTCDACGNLFTTEFIERGKENSTAALADKLDSASRIIPSNMTLLVENTYEPPYFFIDLFKKLPRNIGFTFDVGHANIYHNNLSDYIYGMRDRIMHLHLHDNMGGNSEIFHDTHARPGTGTVNWALFARALNQIGFCGTATYECEPDHWWLDSWN